MRTFIGIEFSRELKKNILNIQNIIKENSIRGRWKYIDNFHLTLKFLGEVSKSQIQDIFDNMKKSMESTKAFTIETGDLGYFQGNGCYRVIYLKLIDNYNNLEKIYNLTEECCTLAGIPKEKRKYTPHITIAQDVVLNKDFNIINEKAGSVQKMIIPVNSINIIKSEQIANKRVYTTIHSINLK